MRRLLKVRRRNRTDVIPTGDDRARRARNRAQAPRRRSLILQHHRRADHGRRSDRLRAAPRRQQCDDRPARRHPLPHPARADTRHRIGRAGPRAKAHRSAFERLRTDDARRDGARALRGGAGTADHDRRDDHPLRDGRDRRLRVEQLDSRPRARRPDGPHFRAANRLCDGHDARCRHRRGGRARSDARGRRRARLELRGALRGRLHRRADQRLDRRAAPRATASRPARQGDRPDRAIALALSRPQFRAADRLSRHLAIRGQFRDTLLHCLSGAPTGL